MVCPRLLSFLAIAIFACRVSAAIGPERPVSDPHYDLSPYSRSPNLVAASPNQFLIANSSLPFGEIRVSRITPNGEVLDRTGVTIAAGAGEPAVIGTQHGFVVAYQLGGEVYTRFVPEMGDPGPAYKLGARASGGIALASNQSRTLVVWVEGIQGLPLWGMLVDGTGQRAGNPFRLGGNVHWPHMVTVASNGDGFLVVWQRRSTLIGKTEIVSASVTASGSAGAEQIVVADVPASFTSHPRLASDGTAYLLSYEEDSGFYALRLDSTGTPSGTTRRYLSGPGFFGSLLWDGTRFLAIIDQNGVRLYELDSHGALERVRDLPGDGPQRRWASGISRGEDTLIVWFEQTNTSSRIAGAILRGEVFSPVQEVDELGMMQTARLQKIVGAASNGFDQFVVWKEYSPHGRITSLLGARFTEDGERIDKSPILLSRPDERVLSAAVSFDGSDYVVAWCRETADLRTGMIHSARVTVMGQVMAVSFEIGTTLNSPTLKVLSLGCSKGRCLVSWMIPDSGLRARVLGRDFLSDPIVVSPAFSPRHATAANGDIFLVAWERSFPLPICGISIAPCTATEIRARRISRDGALLGDEIAVTSQHHTQAPTLASDGHDFLAAWSIKEANSIRTRWVSAQGVIRGDAADGGTTVAIGESPSMAWNGKGYSLALAIRDPFAPDNNIYLTFLDSNGQSSPLAQGAIYTIANSPDLELLPRVSATGTFTLTAYNRHAREPLYGGVERSFFRITDPTSLPDLPSAPTGPRVEVMSNNLVKLSWDPVGGNILRYRIEKRVGPDDWRQAEAVDGNLTEKTVFFTPGETYAFRVRAEDKIGISPASAESPLPPGLLPPGTPTELTARITGPDTVMLSWRGSNTDLYIVEMKEGAKSFEHLASATVTSYSVRNLKRGERYWFRVMALNRVGSSPYSNEISVTMLTSRSRPARPAGSG